MALGVVNRFEPIQNTDDLYKKIKMILKRRNIVDEYLTMDIADLFTEHIEKTVVPALAEILTVMYDGDKESAYADIAIAQLLNSNSKESR